jgi:hypothetical protein
MTSAVRWSTILLLSVLLAANAAFGAIGIWRPGETALVFLGGIGVGAALVMLLAHARRPRPVAGDTSRTPASPRAVRR